MHLIQQYASLLSLYHDVALAIKLNENLTVESQPEFVRSIIKGRINSENEAWLMPYLHQELLFKQKSFLNHLNNDFHRLHQVACIMHVLSDESDEMRLKEMMRRLEDKMVSVFNSPTEVEIPLKMQSLYLKRGFIGIHRGEIDKLSDGMLESEQFVTVDIMCQCSQVYHIVRETMACYGFEFVLPKFKSGEYMKIDIYLNRDAQYIKFFESIGKSELPNHLNNKSAA